MGDTDADARSWLRLGCLAAAVVIGLLVVGGGIVTGVALRQIRNETRETHRLAQQLPDDSTKEANGEPERVPGRVELEISVAQLLIVPAPAGEPIRVDADYDPRSYVLDQRTEEHPGGGWTYRLRLVPSGSSTMALFRVKLGGTPPRVRIALPRHVPLVLAGEVQGGFAAMELGGLRLDAAEMNVSGGAVAISFLEPLSAPMDRLSLVGDKGSVEVTGLGNASPRTAVLEQRFGELDLDLRGAWVRDAEIRLDVEIGGGSVWLPDNVVIEGLEELGGRPRRTGPEELSAPRLHLSVAQRGGRLVIVE